MSERRTVSELELDSLLRSFDLEDSEQSTSLVDDVELGRRTRRVSNSRKDATRGRESRTSIGNT